VGSANGREDTLWIDGLNHYFGSGELRTQILQDIRLAVRPGELVILTGPSGCGKTTLLTLIGGLRRVQEGSLRVLGQELAGLGEARLREVRQGIGFIFQAHNLFESLTALQNVRMAMELTRTDPAGMRADAARALEAVGLGHRVNYKPKGLSGGQRQRVAIARALVNRPRLVLADEPTAALDKESTGTVMDLLEGLKAEGGTILVVTHDTKILGRADRIISMADRQIKSNVTAETFQICEFLRGCPAFTGLGAHELASVASRLRPERRPAGTEVIRQGDEGDKFYIIKEGKAEVFVRDGDATRRVRVLARGDYFGELALMSDRPRSATVLAIDELDLYALDKASFRAALSSIASFEQRLREVFARLQ
jgi:putative ABC transport system ATP-binding protein